MAKRHEIQNLLRRGHVYYWYWRPRIHVRMQRVLDHIDWCLDGDLELKTASRLLSANAANAAKPQRERLTLIQIFEELHSLGYDAPARCGGMRKTGKSNAAAPRPET
ncbi:hypothetical protein FGU64_03175 [Mesorhizobium sp. 8]|nr:hypothetical protein FGU64_03175 [Mesorhizobium sp. 8]